MALSDASCLPEIAGGAALYFNPDDPADIAASIRRVIDNPEERARLIDAGTKRLADFSWQTTAEKTARVYRSVLRPT